MILWLLRCVAVAGLGLTLARQAAAADSMIESHTRPVTNDDMNRLRDYSREAGENWFKDEFGFDLNDLQLVWDPDAFIFRPRGAVLSPVQHATTGAAAPAPMPQGMPELGRSLSLRLEQSNDLSRLASDLRDIPFSLTMEGDMPLIRRLADLKTRISVPFSWKDEMSAEATVPLTLMDVRSGGWWHGLGFGQRLALRSDYRTRLGFNQVEAGFGTDWSQKALGTWNLDYDYHLRYGQGSDEVIQWLKLSKQF